MSEILTPQDLQNKMQKELNKLLELTGNKPSWLADLLKVSPQVVSGWIDRGRISKEGAMRVNCVPVLNARIYYKDLRPDLSHTQITTILEKIKPEFE